MAADSFGSHIEVPPFINRYRRLILALAGRNDASRVTICHDSSLKRKLDIFAVTYISVRSIGTAIVKFYIRFECNPIQLHFIKLASPA